jgi:hypothetical protein
MNIVKLGKFSNRHSVVCVDSPPEEAAGSVYLFCSPDSDYVSGQCPVVNGGL